MPMGKRLRPTRRRRLSIFDRFAETASVFASHAAFFIGCTLVVLLWLPSYLIIRDLNTWQLIINTLTTIITFLLVALLQNSQRRSEEAVHLKLDALADGLADLVSAVGAKEMEETASSLTSMSCMRPSARSRLAPDVGAQGPLRGPRNRRQAWGRIEEERGSSSASRSEAASGVRPEHCRRGAGVGSALREAL
jgi:low affinity Fe/Cu permease